MFSCHIKETVSEERYKDYKFKNKKEEMKTNLEMPRTGEYRAQEQMGHRAGGQQGPGEAMRRARNGSGLERQH